MILLLASCIKLASYCQLQSHICTATGASPHSREFKSGFEKRLKRPIEARMAITLLMINVVL